MATAPGTTEISHRRHKRFTGSVANLRPMRPTRPDRRSYLRVAAGTALVLLVPVIVSAATVPETGGKAQASATSQEVPPADGDGDDGTRDGDDGTRDAAALAEADAADPFVVVDGGQPRLFTTNNAAGNVPVVAGSGGDEVVVSDALPVLPAWSAPGYTWAPAVTRTDDGWVLAFTARHRASGRQCIGVATSSRVDGPYTAAEDPLVCDVDKGGSIDPSFVVDGSGTRWLLYKDDGNCCGLPTAIRTVPLTASATDLAGRPTVLLTADQPWEDGLVEAPTMRRVGDRWLLMYSGNRWDTAGYAIGAAWCDSPAGPCSKQPEPAMTAGEGLDGPGGAEFVSGLGVDGVAVTFHAWPEDAVGYGDGSTRRLRFGRVEIDDQVSIDLRPLGERRSG